MWVLLAGPLITISGHRDILLVGEDWGQPKFSKGDTGNGGCLLRVAQKFPRSLEWRRVRGGFVKHQ